MSNTKAFLDYDKTLEASIDYSNQINLGVEEIDGKLVPVLNYIGDDKENGAVIIDNLTPLLSVEQNKDSQNNISLLIADAPFCHFVKQGDEYHIDETKKQEHLTSFEMKMLARSNNMIFQPFSREGTQNLSKKTDLHTHLAGCLSPEDLIKLGQNHNINIPAWILEKTDIDCSKYQQSDDGQISINDLVDNPSDLKVYINAMKIPNIQQETFNKMEEIYTARKPFTKNDDLFADMLRTIGQRYGQDGIEYTELSVASIIENPKELEICHQIMPEIEKETGTKLRFLASIYRHSDIEWIDDDADRIIAVAKDPYVAGIDFVGHETNSTREFEYALKSVAKYAILNDPTFTLRVHAGENPLFADNVKDALKIIKEAKTELEEEGHQNLSYPQVRIGHGLYGVDDESLALCKELDAVIEFNMSSNLALNNLDSIKEVPISKYAEQGIKFVLGSDGPGIYNTSSEQSIILAKATGVSIDALVDMQKTEDNLISIKQEQFNKKLNAVNKHLSEGNPFSDLYPVKYSTEDGKPRYNQKVEDEKNKQKQELHAHLENKISRCGAKTNNEAIQKDIAGKKPILITGASVKAWPNISEEQRDEVRTALNVLLKVLDTDKSYIVTGGTNHGVEKQMHELANSHNKQTDHKMIVLGTLTEEAAYSELASIEKETITHATVLSLNGKMAKQWFDLPDTVLSFVEERQGAMVAVGGGGVVRDMIQRAHNMEFADYNNCN